MRCDDWQTRFWANITAARDLEFEWGAHDCVMFATSSIDAVLGTDYFAQAQVRYPYTTEEAAIALIQQYGGITGLAESFLEPNTNWGQLGLGDIVFTTKAWPNDPDDFGMLCVHDGQQLIAANTPRGVMRVPFQYARYGWKIR